MTQLIEKDFLKESDAATLAFLGALLGPVALGFLTAVSLHVFQYDQLQLDVKTAAISSIPNGIVLGIATIGGIALAKRAEFGLAAMAFFAGPVLIALLDVAWIGYGLGSHATQSSGNIVWLDNDDPIFAFLFPALLWCIGLVVVSLWAKGRDEPRQEYR